MIENSEKWPFYEDDEIQSVMDVLKSGKVNYWTGQVVKEFEHKFSDFVKVKHSIAVTNGTAALELALHGLAIGARNSGKVSDEVIVTPRSFFASASAIKFAGALPRFADINLDTQNLDPNAVQDLINENTKAIICVHLAGLPCDIDSIRDIIGPRDIKIIEDCAQAHGASYKGQPVGSLGHVSAWSFCQDKIMSTGGEGGMVCTNDTTAWKKMWAFKDHGKSSEKVAKNSDTPGFKWLHDSFGTNLRMTEMQAAIGLLQLTKLPKWTQRRAQIAKQLSFAVNNVSDKNEFRTFGCDCWRKTQCTRKCIHGNYTFNFMFCETSAGYTIDREKIINELNELGVPCLHGSCPEIYKEKAFLDMIEVTYPKLNNAYYMGKNSFMIKIHHRLSDGTINHWSKIISQTLQSYLKS